MTRAAMVPALVIAGVSSGVGKTTVTLAILETTRSSSLGRAGTRARGHEFHRSTMGEPPPSVERVYRLSGLGSPPRAEGYLVGGTLMSYAHLFFASSPGLAPSFVEACARRCP